MRLRNVKGKEDIIKNSKYIILNPRDYKGKWNELFDNDNPIYIEIGMGKGKFIYENALNFPNINFIGIEKFDSVITRALQRVEDSNINNLKMIRIDALELSDIFSKEIDRIYLNFSDPWPKKKHSKRRLTSNIFLKIYDDVFKDVKEIHLKTDNKALFAYSIESLSEYGYILKNVSLDLKNEDIDNITTEYEEKFMEKDIFINRLEAIKK
ncbi:MAG: tRNA (guanosine(46)-N7)-methyltransferase TrmB [Bacilli bacterium]|nr:tRNA (guanosine(46)-N7)-methyltransferase TrmB [Bacilli bacterium]